MIRVEPAALVFGTEGGERPDGGDMKVCPVRPFYLSEYPVSAGQWQVFQRATGYESRACPVETWDFGWTAVSADNGFEPLRTDHPVVGVTFADSVAFCRWISDGCGGDFRLPSEVEFEAAARAGCSCRHYCESARAVREKVRQYGNNASRRPPVLADAGENRLGLRGMHGLIWQWCSDAVTPEGRVPSTERLVSPSLSKWSGKMAQGARIIRGGSFAYPIEFARCASRSISAGTDRNFNLGFRVAMCDHPAADETQARLNVLLNAA